mmetsp:Transcript_26147/g.64577  ORF Transcript_26147/g.64577 Transcript_26147/m.64577 type:complete len:276 (-) Transcript_26147:665-1492(-)
MTPQPAYLQLLQGRQSAPPPEHSAPTTWREPAPRTARAQPLNSQLLQSREGACAEVGEGLEGREVLLDPRVVQPPPVVHRQLVPCLDLGLGVKDKDRCALRHNVLARQIGRVAVVDIPSERPVQRGVGFEGHPVHRHDRAHVRVARLIFEHLVVADHPTIARHVLPLSDGLCREHAIPESVASPRHRQARLLLAPQELPRQLPHAPVPQERAPLVVQHRRENALEEVDRELLRARVPHAHRAHEPERVERLHLAILGRNLDLDGGRLDRESRGIP